MAAPAEKTINDLSGKWVVVSFPSLSLYCYNALRLPLQKLCLDRPMAP